MSVEMPSGCNRSSKRGPFLGELIAARRTTWNSRRRAGGCVVRWRPQRRGTRLRHRRPDGQARWLATIRRAMQIGWTLVGTQAGRSRLWWTTTRSTSSGSRGRKPVASGEGRSTLRWPSEPNGWRRDPQHPNGAEGVSGAADDACGQDRSETRSNLSQAQRLTSTLGLYDQLAPASRPPGVPMPVSPRRGRTAVWVGRRGTTTPAASALLRDGPAL
jgi:hypothetical protein